MDYPDVQNVTVSTASVVVYPPGATLAQRLARDFEFVWIMEGASVAHFDEARIPAPPGAILLRRPGMRDGYEWAKEHRTVHAYFHFMMELPKSGWPSSSEWPAVRLTAGEDVLCPLFRYILSVHLMEEPIRSALLVPTVNLMLKSFVSGRYTQASEPNAQLPLPVEKAMEAIRRAIFFDPPKSLTLSTLARAAHVSPEHLCRLFRRSLNMGPLECARLARAQFAAMLLGRSMMTIKEVAEAAHFSNPYHFARVFRSVYRMTPSQYRREVAAGHDVPQNPIVRMLRFDRG